MSLQVKISEAETALLKVKEECDDERSKLAITALTVGLLAVQLLERRAGD